MCIRDRHYAARRFYAPLLLSIEDDPPRQGVFVTNDRREPWDGTVRWSLETLAGATLTAGEAVVQAAGQATTPVGAFDLADYVTDDNRRDLVFIAELWQGEQLAARQAAYFAPTKHLQLADPQVTADCAGDGQLFHVTLRGRSLARLVEVALEGADVVFSDNYFDLPAGRAVTVTGDLPAGWDGARVVAALRLRSVYDSFQPRGGD